jgi:molecular chaperone DnaJ
MSHSDCRTLNQRQREILQQYADDVEGRAPRNEHETAQKPPSSTGQTQGSSDYKDVKENGTASSHYASPSSYNGGWVSHAWKRMRELTGF